MQEEYTNWKIDREKVSYNEVGSFECQNVYLDVLIKFILPPSLSISICYFSGRDS